MGRTRDHRIQNLRDCDLPVPSGWRYLRVSVPRGEDGNGTDWKTGGVSDRAWGEEMKFWLKVPIYIFWMTVGVVILAIYMVISSVAMFILRTEGRE